MYLLLAVLVQFVFCLEKAFFLMPSFNLRILNLDKTNMFAKHLFLEIWDIGIFYNVYCEL
jgi:hypothetical protein